MSKARHETLRSRNAHAVLAPPRGTRSTGQATLPDLTERLARPWSVGEVVWHDPDTIQPPCALVPLDTWLSLSSKRPTGPGQRAAVLACDAGQARGAGVDQAKAFLAFDRVCGVRTRPRLPVTPEPELTRGIILAPAPEPDAPIGDTYTRRPEVPSAYTRRRHDLVAAAATVRIT